MQESRKLSVQPSLQNKRISTFMSKIKHCCKYLLNFRYTAVIKIKIIDISIMRKGIDCSP